ncbi:MAG: hypothetical protein E5W01_01440 [Mesorhizobium sp.]|nr:MAG: hypothetical protein E5W13_05750 [Mesorhizobium sp.]TIU94649.1 MAG: hypothetical protein E5W01_01440 [Mesorhizobium sp.]
MVLIISDSGGGDSDRAALAEIDASKVGVERSNHFTPLQFPSRESKIGKPRFAAAFWFLGQHQTG